MFGDGAFNENPIRVADHQGRTIASSEWKDFLRPDVTIVVDTRTCPSPRLPGVVKPHAGASVRSAPPIQQRQLRASSTSRRGRRVDSGGFSCVTALAIGRASGDSCSVNEQMPFLDAALQTLNNSSRSRSRQKSLDDEEKCDKKRQTCVSMFLPGRTESKIRLPEDDLPALPPLPKYYPPSSPITPITRRSPNSGRVSGHGRRKHSMLSDNFWSGLGSNSRFHRKASRSTTSRNPMTTMPTKQLSIKSAWKRLTRAFPLFSSRDSGRKSRRSDVVEDIPERRRYISPPPFKTMFFSIHQKHYYTHRTSSRQSNDGSLESQHVPLQLSNLHRPKSLAFFPELECYAVPYSKHTPPTPQRSASTNRKHSLFLEVGHGSLQRQPPLYRSTSLTHRRSQKGRPEIPRRPGSVQHLGLNPQYYTQVSMAQIQETFKDAVPPPPHPPPRATAATAATTAADWPNYKPLPELPPHRLIDVFPPPPSTRGGSGGGSQSPSQTPSVRISGGGSRRRPRSSMPVSPGLPEADKRPPSTTPLILRTEPFSIKFTPSDDL